MYAEEEYTVPKFRKKPVVIEAWQLPMSDAETRVFNDTPDIILKRKLIGGVPMVFEAIISTLEGVMTAADGDWIIKGVEGELYPCKPGIFAATYEPVSE